MYSASSCIHTSNALFVTNHSCRLHSRRVQPANTGWRTGWPGSPVSCTKVPTFRNHIMGYYSFNRPRRDGRLSWPCWLTDSGRFTHKVVKRPSISLAQDKESSPARTNVLTTMLRHCRSSVCCAVLPTEFIRTSGFSVAGPMTWNSLPRHLRYLIHIISVFGRLLKTFIFSEYQCTQCIRGFWR